MLAASIVRATTEFEYKIVVRIFGPKRDLNDIRLEKVASEKLHNLDSLSLIYY
jgi:hypothetical protein